MFDVIRDELRAIESQWDDERHELNQTIADRDERIEELEDELNDAHGELRDANEQNGNLALALAESAEIIQRQRNAIIELENELQG
ncbi:hypothetical protein TacPo2_31 [Pantoea bacteriophage TacPo2]